MDFWVATPTHKCRRSKVWEQGARGRKGAGGNVFFMLVVMMSIEKTPSPVCRKWWCCEPAKAEAEAWMKCPGGGLETLPSTGRCSRKMDVPVLD